MREYKGKNIIALPTEYVVIDTETTGLDYDHCNLIEISALRYSNGVCVDKFSSLVKPPLRQMCRPFCDDGPLEWVDFYVDDFIANLTGITNEMLELAPLPEEVIPQFMNFIGNDILIAHNANFDINFLYDAAAELCDTPLTNNFIDTLRIARKVFPDLKHHRLSDVAEACSVKNIEAHRAESDCITTANCYWHMRNKVLQNTTEADFISASTYNYEKALASVVATTNDIDITNPIHGKVVVFTGTLSSMSRKEAFQLVVNLGGIPENSVTKNTNYLVIGSDEFAQSVKNGKTNKMIKAESYISKGLEVSIISETTFFDLIAEYLCPDQPDSNGDALAKGPRDKNTDPYISLEERMSDATKRSATVARTGSQKVEFTK